MSASEKELSVSGDSYIGSELEVFALAKNWKTYWSRMVRPYIGSNVLEVGAGMGATIPLLCDQRCAKWVALEPDPVLAEKIRADNPPKNCEIRTGTLSSIPTGEQYDTVIYIDVLEHIENDKSEVAQAAERLSPGGRLIILSPAHQFLFSPFDAAVGHFRRYNSAALKKITPETLSFEKGFYLDSIGLFASLGNKLLLKSSHPSRRQIALWDNFMVPLSKAIDPILFHSLGKTVIAIWRRPDVNEDVNAP